MKATLTHIDRVTPNIYTYWFKTKYPLRFDAGQFVEIYLPHSPADDRGEWREFSLSSSPHEESFSITTSFFNRSSTYKMALRTITPGTEFFMNEPMGDFVLPKDQSLPLVFIAAGLGSVPFLSMIKWLTKRGEQRKIQLIYSVRHTCDFHFSEVWERYGLDFIPVVTKPDSTWEGVSGRLTVSTTLELIGPLENKLIYLAGPKSLIEPLYNSLLTNGVPRSQLLLDYYPGY